MSWYETTTQMVEAKQRTLLNTDEIEGFIGGDGGRCPREHHGCMVFATKEGALHVPLSSYVIKDENGRFSVENQNSFRQTHNLIQRDPYGD